MTVIFSHNDLKIVEAVEMIPNLTATQCVGLMSRTSDSVDLSSGQFEVRCIRSKR